MPKYSMFERLPTDCWIDYIPVYYNTPSYLDLNNNLPQRHFYWVDEGDNRTVAHCSFSIDGDMVLSPFKAPFAGLEVSKSLSTETIRQFIDEVESQLIKSDIEEVRLSQSPVAYNHCVSIDQALEESGYNLIEERTFHVIAVNDADLIGRMHKMEQRKVAKAVQADAIFKLMEGEEANEAIKWIVREREKSAKPASLSLDELLKSIRIEPGVYHIFGVFIEERLVAATLAIRVNSGALYHFLPTSLADSSLNQQFSPMVFLVHELYKWCQEECINLLDLGTSYVNSATKASLVSFKENLGGEPSFARSWQKTLIS